MTLRKGVCWGKRASERWQKCSPPESWRANTREKMVGSVQCTKSSWPRCEECRLPTKKKGIKPDLRPTHARSRAGWVGACGLESKVPEVNKAIQIAEWEISCGGYTLSERREVVGSSSEEVIVDVLQSCTEQDSDEWSTKRPLKRSVWRAAGRIKNFRQEEESSHVK